MGYETLKLDFVNYIIVLIFVGCDCDAADSFAAQSDHWIHGSNPPSPPLFESLCGA